MEGKAGNLQREDWIRAGARAMGADGVEGVKVERLARDLGVSKGSFYWHFRDRAELLEAIVSAWEQGTVTIMVLTDQGRTGPDRLAMLLDAVGKSSSGLELALQAWARQDPQVAARLSAVEQRRIAYVEQIFCDCGFDLAEARFRAETAYLVYLGWMNMASRDPAFRQCEYPFRSELSRLFLARPNE